jgi:hypothetical protein
MMRRIPRMIREARSYAAALMTSCIALATLAACGGSQPASADGPAGTFTQIYQTVLSTDTESRCNFCHSMPASQVSNGMFHTGMDQAETYAALIDKTSLSTACSGRSVIVPFEPDQSLLFLKVAGQPPCGNRMPLGGKALSAAQIQMIQSWIAAGANND